MSEPKADPEEVLRRLSINLLMLSEGDSEDSRAIDAVLAELERLRAADWAQRDAEMAELRERLVEAERVLIKSGNALLAADAKIKDEHERGNIYRAQAEEAGFKREQAEQRAERLAEALRGAVKRLRDHRSYYIADNRLGLNPTGDDEVVRTDGVIQQCDATLADSAPAPSPEEKAK